MHVYSLHALRHRRRRFLGDGGSLSTELRKLKLELPCPARIHFDSGQEPSKVLADSGPTEAWALSWASLASHSARLRSACQWLNLRLALVQGTLMVSK